MLEMPMKRRELLQIFDNCKSCLEHQSELSENQIMDAFFKALRIWEMQYIGRG